MTEVYKVVRNSCNCHPQTCCCMYWRIECNGVKHSTYYNQTKAQEVADALNLVKGTAS